MNSSISGIFSKILDIDITQAVQLLSHLTPYPPLVEPIQPNFANVEEGDHLFYKTPFGMNVHFYVKNNLGDGKIEVYGRFRKGNDDPFVEQKSFFDQTASASSLKLEKRVLDIAILELNCLKRKLYESTNISEEKERLEKYKIQKLLHGFLSNNSEHFVTFVKTGTAQCEIVSEFKKALRKHFTAQVAVHGGIDALKAAMKDGNWAALVAVLKKMGVISAEGSIAESAGGSGAKPAAKTAAVQTIKSLGTVQAAKTAVKSAVKGTIVVQVVFEGAVYTFSISQALYEYVNGRMSKEEFKNYAVKRSTTAVGSLTGGIGGSLAGIGAGAAFGSVVPVIGTAIGGTVGGIVGGVSGGLGGTTLGRLTGNLLNWLRNYCF